VSYESGLYNAGCRGGNVAAAADWEAMLLPLPTGVQTMRRRVALVVARRGDVESCIRQAAAENEVLAMDGATVRWIHAMQVGMRYTLLEF